MKFSNPVKELRAEAKRWAEQLFELDSGINDMIVDEELDDRRYYAFVRAIAIILATERASSAKRIAHLEAMLAESDRHAQKIEALLEPHIKWDDVPAA